MVVVPRVTDVSDRRPDSRELARTLFDAARDDEITVLAAAIAYYAFVSLVPLLLLVLSVAAAVDAAALGERIVALTGELLTAEAQELVQGAVAADSAGGGATLVGLGVLIWSGLRVFRGLDRAFSVVYGVTEQRSLPAELRDAMVALGAIGVGLATVTVVLGVVDRFTGVLGVFGGAIVLVATLGVSFFPLYYCFPGVRMGPREPLPGTAFAAVGWTLLGEGFRVYAAVAAASLYGVLGAALLLITWLYLGALVLLLGAVVNAALAGRFAGPSEDRQLQQ